MYPDIYSFRLLLYFQSENFLCLVTTLHTGDKTYKTQTGFKKTHKNTEIKKKTTKKHQLFSFGPLI